LPLIGIVPSTPTSFRMIKTKLIWGLSETRKLLTIV